MDKKNYMVLNHEGEHEFDITQEFIGKSEKYTLFRSNSPTWNQLAKGEKLLSLVDDGDGIKFDRSLKSLDYAELFELRILLNFAQRIDVNPHNHDKYRIIENKTLFEI